LLISPFVDVNILLQWSSENNEKALLLAIAKVLSKW
jgi:hypothetical protein